MPFVSVTRLRVKSLFFLFSFMRANEASVKELKSSSGLLMGKELIEKKLTFWTITLWENEESMKRFRGSSSHKNAMKYLPKCCNEASYHHWVQEENEIPNWTTISDKLFSQGKLSKVRNPSNAQITNQFPPIQWTKFERKLK